MNMIVLRLIILPLLFYHVSVHGDAGSASTNRGGVDYSLKDKAELEYVENKVWDVVAVTDWYGDKDPGANEEDEYFIKALESLGRKVIRVRIDDDEFDWESTKSVVIRSAWAKVRKRKDTGTLHMALSHTHFQYTLASRSFLTWRNTNNSLTGSILKHSSLTPGN